MPARTKCHLHVPHKMWAGEDHEQQNYLHIERWCRDYLRRYVTYRPTRETPLIFPYKGWATPEEAENYFAMERWVYIAVPASLGQTKVGFTRYDLHIPHKEWAVEKYGDDGMLEKENYLAIERWAFTFIRVCLPIGS